MPPQIFLLLVVGLIAFAFAYIVMSRKNFKKELLKQQENKALINKITLIEDNLSSLEKRITNVETIVTDTKFEENSGREAINLKSELIELKSIIKNLQK